ncbi:hypothetical protein MHYP_G00103340 [Metynnis hypsauchen]
MTWSVLLWASVKIVGLLFLAVPGSLGQIRRVTHIPSKICSLHHTSVVLPCKLTYPSGEVVTTSVWHYKKQADAEPVVVSVVQGSGQHVENCSLRLSNVTQDKAGIYQFSFTTNISTQNLTNEGGVTLEITDLEVDMVSESDIVLEGEWVMLFCGTCIPSLTLPTYIWHKDGRPHSRIYGVNQLELQEAKPEDSGTYSCSIGGQEGLLSSSVNFTVEWAPKNISVSISPSGEIVEGSSVNLTCSSDGNPPVKIYTWFKGSTTVGEGKTYSIPNIRSEDSGEYTCQSRNDHGERRSTAVLIDVACHSLSLYVIVVLGFCGVVALLAIGFCTRSKRQNQNRKTDNHDFQNADPIGNDDTYTALDLTTRTNDNVYESLGMSSMLLWASVKTVGLLFLAVPGSLGQIQRVTHVPNKICSLHHTSVVLPCKLTYPSGEVVTTSVWHYKKQADAEPVVVSVVQGSGQHVENCSLRLSNVTQDKAGIYQFSFTTNISTQNLTNEDGVTLEITDLEVEIVAKSDVVLQGEWVTLLCGTCIPSLTLPTYIWHKDGRPHSRIHGVNQLELQEAKPEDSGSYSCSISGHEGLLSSPVNFTVQWPPKNISVSISWSGEIVEGSSATLICSSDANPPVKSYTWFKEGGTSPVGSGHKYSFSLNPRSGGLYYCEAENEHGSLRSASVLVVLNAGHSMTLYVPVGAGFCGIAVLIAIGFCIRCKMHKQNRKTDKQDCQNADQNAKDDTYTALDLTTRTNDNVYEMLGNVHLSPPVDTCISDRSDYENVETLGNMMNTNQS